VLAYPFLIAVYQAEEQPLSVCGPQTEEKVTIREILSKVQRLVGMENDEKLMQ
jgi:hypothetical protein